MKKLVFIFLFLAYSVAAQLSLPSVINNNMVLQRNVQIPIWGKAVPLTKVTVKFMEQKKSAVADVEGNWIVNLKPVPKTFNRQKMLIETKKETIILTNILVGEVWLCSGQSNMQFPLRRVNNAKEAIRAATNSFIRFIGINRFNFKPYECDNCLGSWTVCSPKPAYNLTAAGYYFAQNIFSKLDTPVGIIESDFGGTKIETWTKAEILKKWPWLKKDVEQFAKYNNYKTFNLLKKKELESWFNSLKELDKGFEKEWMSSGLDDSDWQKIKMPQVWGDKNSKLKNFHGSVWLRKKIVIPDDWKNKTLSVNPGGINSKDIVWLNGKIAGMTQIFGLGHHQRNYELKADEFVPGTNTIVIYNYSGKHDGGLKGPAKSMRIYPKGEVEKAINISGEWLYKISYKGINMPEAPLSLKLCYKSPAVLYNTMIAPLIPYAIKGVLWYQGESNQKKPECYTEMFKDLVESWRFAWNQGDFPFYFVQIAPYNYNNKINSALLREAQMLSLNITNTGMAVTLDIGNPENIHPKNKKEVGRRLALWAFAKNYGFTNIVFSGPIYKGMKVDGNKIILSFDYAKGLKSRDGKELTCFEIAGKDGKFYPAEGRIENDKAILSSEKVKKPAAARYAWSDTAEPNLCNGAGLPASSFRTKNY